MAPSRRKTGSKGIAKGELRLGDLVLAKVKGFPAWPAKVRLLLSLSHAVDARLHCIFGHDHVPTFVFFRGLSWVLRNCVFFVLV